MSNRLFAFFICASAAFACVSVHVAGAASNDANAAPTQMLKSDYRIAKDKLEADFRGAKSICEVKKGAEERTCSKDAEAAHEKAEKDLKAAFYGSR
jgi:hypothetical protein